MVGTRLSPPMFAQNDIVYTSKIPDLIFSILISFIKKQVFKLSLPRMPLRRDLLYILDVCDYEHIFGIK